MNKRAIFFLVMPLAFGSAVASAAPDRDAPAREGAFPAGHEHPAFPLPPRPEPVYAVTQQTDSPNDALKTIASQTPQIKKGNYTVRMEIIPNPPEPDRDGKPQPGQQGR